jgi:hypothetical protein
MKSYESDDELERALFALPLEEPPADLRASILAGTIYRPPVAVKPWEIWTLGALCAIFVWLLVLVAGGMAAPLLGRFDLYLNSGLAAFAQPATLFWIAVGGAAVFCFSQLNLTGAPGVERVVRR